MIEGLLSVKPPQRGNLLRSGDIRGCQSMARMYTRLAAMPKKG